MNGQFDGDLLATSRAANLCKALKDFNQKHAFAHRTVLETELDGYNLINELMDFFWVGITKREKYSVPGSRRNTPFAAYVYSRISRNYRRVFEDNVFQYRPPQFFPVRYREMQLLTDMISGMTDRFCIDLHRDLWKHHREMKPL